MRQVPQPDDLVAVRVWFEGTVPRGRDMEPEAGDLLTYGGEGPQNLLEALPSAAEEDELSGSTSRSATAVGMVTALWTTVSFTALDPSKTPSARWSLMFAR